MRIVKKERVSMILRFNDPRKKRFAPEKVIRSEAFFFSF